MQIGLLTRWAWRRLLPLVFLPSFSRRGLARISLVCVQEGGWCQLSNATHRLIITFPIFPFIKPVNHFGSSGCGGRGKSNQNLLVRTNFKGNPVQPFKFMLERPLQNPHQLLRTGTSLSPDHLLPCCYSWTESWLSASTRKMYFQALEHRKLSLNSSSTCESLRHFVSHHHVVSYSSPSLGSFLCLSRLNNLSSFNWLFLRNGPALIFIPLYSPFLALLGLKPKAGLLSTRRWTAAYRTAALFVNH